MWLFGSIYLCEKLSSTMNLNKSKLRDEQLQAILSLSCFPPSSQMGQSCGRGSAAKSLAARRKEEKPRLWRTAHVPHVLNWYWWRLGQLYIIYLFFLNTWCGPVSPRPYLEWPPGKGSLRPLVETKGLSIAWDEEKTKTMKLKPHNQWPFIITGTVCYTK